MDPAAGPAADPPARLAAVPRRRRGPLVPRACRTAARASSARNARLGQPCSGWPGRRPSTSPQPATTRSWTSRRPTWRPSSPCSRCRPGKHGHGLRSPSLVADRLGLSPLHAGPSTWCSSVAWGPTGCRLIGTGDWNDGLDEIGSQGRGESVWLGFFLYYILQRMDGHHRRARTGPRGESTMPGGQANSRTPWSAPGAAIAICGRSTTTARKSASKAAASGKSTP